jgi:hypothetical protein
MTAQPWSRTGPGKAKDGKPKFNLDSFDQTYFDRLRERVIAAGEISCHCFVGIAMLHVSTLLTLTVLFKID